MAREVGAKRVYVASAAPPVRFPNVYGIDMPTKEELIATNESSNKMVESHVASAIGADRVVYQDLSDLLTSITEEASLAGAKPTPHPKPDLEPDLKSGFEPDLEPDLEPELEPDLEPDRRRASPALRSRRSTRVASTGGT